MLGHTGKLVIFLLTVLLSKNVTAGAIDWLMKINSAAAEVNFAGTFVYIHDGKVEVMEVARRVTKDGMIQEHMRTLNGPSREVVRDMNDVWYYIPDQHTVVHDYRQTPWRGFSKILASDLQQLGHLYRFVEGEELRIANRLTRQIDIVPNDDYRYGYSLWADSITGLLLRTDLINQQGGIVEQYLFIDVEIGGDITDAQLAAVSDKDKLQLLGHKMPATTPVKISDWQLMQIPDGYTLSKHIRRISPINSKEVEHLVYTDGLSSISIFIREIQDGQSEMSGLSQMGAVHAYHKQLSNHRITVMGEVPAKTVEYFAQSLKYFNRDGQ